MVMNAQSSVPKNAFEVLANEQYIVLKGGASSLWFNRSHPTPTNGPATNINAAFSPKVAPVPEFRLIRTEEEEKTAFADFTCHGLAYGLIGLFLADKLLLIRQAASVGRLPFGRKDEVFKVAKICVLSLCSRAGEMVGDLGLDKCTQDTCTKPVIIMPSPNEPVMLSASFSKAQSDSGLTADQDSSASLTIHTAPAFQSTSLSVAAATAGAQKTWNQIKQTASNVSSKTTGRGGGGSGTSGDNSQSSQAQSRVQDEKEKFERRFIDELYKMFNETNSFYFSWTGDLTQSVQRQQKQRQYFEKNIAGLTDIRTVPLWKRVDDRFFWNRYMLRSVVEALQATPKTPTNEDVSSKSDKTTSTTPTENVLQTYSHLWILPIIQGFVQIEKCYFDLSESSPVGGGVLANSEVKDFGTKEGEQQNPNSQQKFSSPVVKSNSANFFLEAGRDYYLMTLISRRSRFRAGTRYKKRGLDEDGRCANYVETEQIFSYGSHTVAFVLVRGSVPLFWSQHGTKYRPPPRLERSEAENQIAFRRHFEHEFAIYEGDTVAVSLIEQTGREKILGDAFLEHVIKMDDARLAYVAFDFHDYCRGMRFENVSILIDRVYEFIKDIRYCWVDDDGMICEQRGVFRINCIDCLDRTNIVMTAIAKAVMDIQLVRLGLLPPEGQLPANSRRIFQLMWAHNGDTISRQYAGTAALKGDYTRTGERKISGVVRDGVNSANRYYLNRFKDAYRQAVIDIMQGCPVEEALSSPDDSVKPSSSGSALAAASALLSKSSSSSSISGQTTGNLSATGNASTASLSVNDPEYHERVKLVIEDCKKILVPEEEVILGGWPLVDADPVTGTSLSAASPRMGSGSELPESEMDTVLILTKDCYYVADYDDQTDRIVKYQKVLLEDLEKIELGPEPNYSSGPFGRASSASGSSRNLISYALRLHYTIADQTGYFHIFRSTGTRFFNNMAIPIRTREEALESLKAIAESFKVALSVKQCNVPFHECRLEKRKSRRLMYSGGPGGSGSSTSSSDASNGRFRGVTAGGDGNSGGGSSGGGASRKLFTGMYSSFSRVLRGKISGAGLQLDGLATPGSKSTTLYEENLPEDLTTFQADTSPKKPLFKIGHHEDDEAAEILDEEESEDESTASDSIFKIRKRRFNPASSSSSLVVEQRTLSSDLSESEPDFGGLELGSSCSELMQLPPISELGSPVDDGARGLCCKEGLHGREHMDRVLESCGILLTSPPLRTSASPSNRAAEEHFREIHGRSHHHCTSSRSPSPPLLSRYASNEGAPAVKSVLADVDDFVLESMKKASLRQLHRKAVSTVSLSGGGGSSSLAGGKRSPKISVEQQGSVSEGKDRSRCIFSSELALNSIVSQSIKRDISYDDGIGARGLKLSSSLSTDAIDSGGGPSVLGGVSHNKNVHNNHQQQQINYPLMSSSSFAGGLSCGDDDRLGSFDDSLNILVENSMAEYDHDLNRANLDSAMLLASCIGSKESSLSVSDLAGLGGLGVGVASAGGGLKTSLSSTTLQNSGPMSLNLPHGPGNNISSNTGASLLLNSCASSINLNTAGGGASNDSHLHVHSIPTVVAGHASSSVTSSTPSSTFASSFMVKKDLVLSPLTRIAKGMQSLGLNLRSGNAGSASSGEVVDAELEKRKQQTRSRIIEI